MHYTITERWLDGLHGPMRYWESAPQQGLPVLLIHGYGGLIEHWRRIMRPLAARHSVFGLDLYGFGHSARLREPPSRQIWASQLAEFVSVACPGPVVVVGHSLGGMVAAQFAHDYPQFTRGLVLVSSVGLADPANPHSTGEDPFFRLTGTDGIGEVLIELVRNRWVTRQALLTAYHNKACVTPELVDTFAEPLLRYGARSYLAVTRAFPNLFLDFARGAVTAPSLLIWGEQDHSVPVGMARLFKQQLLPQAEIRTIPATGHCPFDETPGPFLDALLPWLDQLQPAA